MCTQVGRRLPQAFSFREAGGQELKEGYGQEPINGDARALMDYGC